MLRRSGESRLIFPSKQSFFESRPCLEAKLPHVVDQEAYASYCDLLSIPKSIKQIDILRSLNAVTSQNAQTVLNNLGVLMFSKSPRDFIPEAFVTAVRYRGHDRFTIIDRKDFTGHLRQQVEDVMAFARSHVEVEYEISTQARRQEHFKYPLTAIREAVVNAVVHRDYSFQNSCIYVHIYSDRFEIESPGGILANLGEDDIVGKSLRRNPGIANLMYRGGYGEKIGSGLVRMREVLKQNGNPPYHITATNFFAIRFLPRVSSINEQAGLNDIQKLILLHLSQSNAALSSTEISQRIAKSTSTVSRQLKDLIEQGRVLKTGTGKSMRYRAKT